MRRIDFDLVKDTVCDLAIRANTNLRADVLIALKKAYRKEKSFRAKRLLKDIIENARIAKRQNLAICQDTGMPVVFVEIGKDIIVSNGGIERAIQQGIESGYKKGSLRNSIIKDPLRQKKEKSYFGPAIIHYSFNNSHKLKITVLPKGFGCENKSRLKMFLPTSRWQEIKKFILDSVKEAGPDACPPYIIGVGIGGTADYASLLAKKALVHPIRTPRSRVGNQFYTRKSLVTLEKELLSEINKLDIGAMGLGGRMSALALKILTHPTHIAGLPIAVNISCHALRSASKII